MPTIDVTSSEAYAEIAVTVKIECHECGHELTAQHLKTSKEGEEWFSAVPCECVLEKTANEPQKGV